MSLLSARRIACTLAVALVAGTAAAAELAVPQGEVILTVSGEIEVTNAGDTAQFDLASLIALDRTEITTGTIWTEGPRTFEGVSMARLMDLLGVEEGTLLATAVNDYTISIPMSDIVEGGPIIAYHMDGEPMSLRDKGPLWIMYPFDTNPDYRSEVIYSRSIWQLNHIEVTR